MQITTTEEYPHLRPATQRRGFVHETIKVSSGSFPYSSNDRTNTIRSLVAKGATPECNALHIGPQHRNPSYRSGLGEQCWPFHEADQRDDFRRVRHESFLLFVLWLSKWFIVGAGQLEGQTLGLCVFGWQTMGRNFNTIPDYNPKGASRDVNGVTVVISIVLIWSGPRTSFSSHTTHNGFWCSMDLRKTGNGKPQRVGLLVCGPSPELPQRVQCVNQTKPNQSCIVYLRSRNLLEMVQILSVRAVHPNQLPFAFTVADTQSDRCQDMVKDPYQWPLGDDDDDDKDGSPQRDNNNDRPNRLNGALCNELAQTFHVRSILLASRWFKRILLVGNAKEPESSSLSSKTTEFQLKLILAN